MNPPFELPLLVSALDRALRITNQRLGNIQLIDWKAGYLEIVAQQGFQPDFLDCFRRVTSSDSCASGRALLMRASIMINDVTQDDRFAPFRALAASAGFRAVQSTPLNLAQRRSPRNHPLLMEIAIRLVINSKR
jgi:GAF domain-containing protein